MATMNPMHTDPHSGKASSLPGGAAVSDGSAASRKGGRRSAGREELNERRGMRRGNGLIVDAILILIVAGIVVGAWFGYRALKANFAPAWQEKDVLFTVEIPAVDPNILVYGDDGQLTLVNKDLWSSDRTDADRLGLVVSADTVALDEESTTVTLYVTVSARAKYRPGDGYWMGGTRLLAGNRAIFRLEGLVAPGQILTLDEADHFRPLITEETETDEDLSAEDKEADRNPGGGLLAGEPTETDSP